MRLAASRRRWIVALLGVALLGGCGDDAGSARPAPPGGAPYDPAAEVRPKLMSVEPEVVVAGGQLSVFFPDERVRGIHFVLEAGANDTWTTVYHLISDWGEGRAPRAIAAGESVDIEDIGIGGPGPDAVIIPADVARGSYRLCTGNSRPNICALLTVVSRR